MTDMNKDNFVEIDYSIEKIAIVKINRPESKNALNTEVRKQLAQAFSELSFNDDIHAIVLTGVMKCLQLVQI